ncbi:MAG: flagellar hook-basal body complex protein [Oscillospiraceae bacterium]|nr:flagellar hook-basal body complex protein [Oscillospiraceae bacterium]
MLRSLTSGVSGLKAHQTQMDVIGNNIANVNTTAFKSSRVTFKDVYYQTLSNATASTENQGGTNAKQVGYGSTVSTIDVINTRGGYSSTDRTLDLYLAGDGYFTVQDMAGNKSYTRAGNFIFDTKGGLVDSKGNYVAGWQPVNAGDGAAASPITIDNINDYTDIAIGSDGKITGVYAGVASQHTPNAYESVGSLNGAETTAYENISYANGVLTGDSKATAATGVQFNNITINADGTITGNNMTSLSVEVIGNLTDFTAEPADYSEWIISTNGTVSGLYRGHFTDKVEAFGSINGPSLNIAGYTNVVYANGSITGTDTTTGVNSIIYNNVKLGAGGVFTGDNVASGATGETITGLNLDSMLTNPALYTDITLAEDGTVSGRYISAQNPEHITDEIEVLGQISVAKFSNEAGLSQEDGIYFKETKNSGIPLVTIPGENATGTIVSGALEMSNVDLSKEFTDMITTQRGFQANSRVITVSDEMLEELVNLKR